MHIGSKVDWSGAFSGAVTPFNIDGTVDLAQYDRVIACLSNSGLAGIVVNAMISEGSLLSLDERVNCVKHAAGRDKRPAIISGVYGSSTRDAAEEARLCARAGADGLLIWPNQAFGGGAANTDMIVDYYSALHDASGLPLIVFRLPESVAPEMGADALFALAQTPGVVAVKDSVADADLYTGSAAVFLTEQSPLKILVDNDLRLLGMLQRGAHGAMSIVSAIFPQAIVDLVRLRDHAAASELQITIEPLASALPANPIRDFRARIKYLLVRTGVLTSAEVRRPLIELSVAERNALDQAYKTTKENLARYYAKFPVAPSILEESRATIVTT